MLLSVLLSILVVCQILALIYARNLVANAALDVPRRHASCAANSVWCLFLVTLLFWNTPWYKEPPMDGPYRLLVAQLRRLFTAEKPPEWMELVVYRGLPAVLVATLAAAASGAFTQVFANNLNSVRPRFRQPSGPFQNR